jgi:hypothetical protein
MDLVQQGSIGRQATGISGRYFRAATYVAALVIAAIAVGLLIVAMTAPPANTGQLGSPEWREFRASERLSWPAGDPLAEQSVIDFRNSEHAEYSNR